MRFNANGASPCGVGKPSQTPSVVTGWMRYYAVPLTYDILAGFRRHVTWLWCKSLRRRSQKGRMTWRDMFRLANIWLPMPRIYHPYPWERLRVRSKARAV